MEEWGARRLAYPIDYKNDGYYVLMSFTSEPSFPKELDRVLGITDGIMRSLIVCKGDMPAVADLFIISEFEKMSRKSFVDLG